MLLHLRPVAIPQCCLVSSCTVRTRDTYVKLSEKCHYLDATITDLAPANSLNEDKFDRFAKFTQNSQHREHLSPPGKETGYRFVCRSPHYQNAKKVKCVAGMFAAKI